MNWKRFFRAVAAVTFVVAVALGSFLFGTGRSPSPVSVPTLPQPETVEDSVQQTQTPSPSPAKLPAQPTDQPTAQPTDQPADSQVTAGGAAGFTDYGLILPIGWRVKHQESTQDLDLLILAKAGNEITIRQEKSTVYRCLYPGDREVKRSKIRYGGWSLVQGAEGLEYRRAKTADGTGYELCQKQPNGSFDKPTTFGYITYQVPDAPASALFEEMDIIMASLRDI